MPSLLPPDNFRNPAALARFALTTVVGLAVDLFTKWWAFAELAVMVKGQFYESKTPVRFIPGWLHFEVTTNKGAVFGLGQGQRPLFIVVSIAAVAFLTYLFANSGRQRFYQFILGMLLAGVLGNMYDRIVFGEVRDMIHALPQWPRLFPWIFNVADILLCVGVGLMVLYSLLFPRPEDDAKPGGFPAQPK
jgi:lipoprotein signal peptidase